MNGKNLNGRIELLLEIYDQAFDRPAWHGPNLRGSIRGLTPRELLWRPSPKRHNIWEIILHTAYWKYALHRKFTGGKRGAFPHARSNWPRLPEKADEAAWKSDLKLLLELHRLLRDDIQNLPASALTQRAPQSKYRYARLIYGIASHDLYHAGQIGLLKRMQKE